MPSHSCGRSSERRRASHLRRCSLICTGCLRGRALASLRGTRGRLSGELLFELAATSVNALFRRYFPNVRRSVVRGLPRPPGRCRRGSRLRRRGRRSGSRGNTVALVVLVCHALPFRLHLSHENHYTGRALPHEAAHDILTLTYARARLKRPPTKDGPARLLRIVHHDAVPTLLPCTTEDGEAIPDASFVNRLPQLPEHPIREINRYLVFRPCKIPHSKGGRGPLREPRPPYALRCKLLCLVSPRRRAPSASPNGCNARSLLPRCARRARLHARGTRA